MSSVLKLIQAGLHIEKWHGARNDFLFAEAHQLFAACHEQPTDAWIASVALELCQRHLGLGADGLVVWHKSSQGELLAGIWNSDGSRAGTCGNALRCLAAQSLAHGIWDGQSRLPVFELSIQNKSPASSGRVFASLLHSEGLEKESGLYRSRVAMGDVLEIRTLGRNQVAQPDLMGGTVAQELLLAALESAAFVQLANPHLVLMLKPNTFQKFTSEHFSELGILLQSEIFCKVLNIPLSNIGFVEIKGNPTAASSEPHKAIVFERGAGLTQCCGSGGCAMKVALEQNRHSAIGQSESFAMPGGVISIEKKENALELLGPAQRICRFQLSES